MPFKIITLPFINKDQCFSADWLNEFCQNKKIVFYRTEFFCLQDRPYWTVFLETELVLEQKAGPAIIFNTSEKLRVFFRISYDRHYISIKQHEYISSEINETGKMIGGWLKKC